uniref:Putative secreted peptide n=1 Tax=Anopheles braziliensis TaxID=58242 RepID=A0A2M3ZX59_9DIPT
MPARHLARTGALATGLTVVCCDVLSLARYADRSIDGARDGLTIRSCARACLDLGSAFWQRIDVDRRCSR